MKQITALISLFIASLCLLYLLSTAGTNAGVTTRRDLSYSMYEVPSGKTTSIKLVLTYPENPYDDITAGGGNVGRVYATWESQDQFFATVGANYGICKAAQHQSIRIHIVQLPPVGLENQEALARLEGIGVLTSSGLFSDDIVSRLEADFAMPIPDMTASHFDPINGQILLTSTRRSYLQIGTAVVFAFSLLIILAQAAITLRHALRSRAWINDASRCSRCGYEFGQGVTTCPECGLKRAAQSQSKTDTIK